MTGAEPARDTANILGDPRKALLAMVVPIAIGLLVQSLNNIVDAVWVSGVGTGALAATGVVFPFFFILIGIGNGLGVGASQAIARRIGTGDREGAGRVASQTLVIGVLVGLVITAIFALFPEGIFAAAGGGEYMEEVLAYGIPVMVCAPVYMVSFVFSALLRSEGAARMSMAIQVAAVAVHLVLDPVLIYGLDMGVEGAAVASAISMLVASALAVWIYRHRDTYVRISFKGFRFDRALDWDILRVGIPASVEMILVSVSTLLMNIMIEALDPLNGVAIYTTGWRILDLVMIVAISFGSALVPISAAAYGQGSYARIRATYTYALRYGIVAMLALVAIAELAAPALVHLFTYTGDAAGLAEEMTRFVRVGLLMMPFCTVGILTSSLFQSIGRGLWALLASSLRNFIRVPLCLVMGTTLAMVWWSVTLGEVVGTCVVAAFGLYALARIRRELGGPDVPDGTSRRGAPWKVLYTGRHKMTVREHVWIPFRRSRCVTMDSLTIVYACIIVLLVICSAFFSLTETAFTSANRVRLKRMANDGNAKAERALSMLEDYDRFLTTNLIGVNVVNIASSTIATVMFVALFGDLGSLVNIVVMTLVSLTFCEIIPKSVAKKSPEKWCVRTANVFGGLVRVLSPVSFVFTKLTKAIGEDENTAMSDEELEVLIDECQDGGVLKNSESELIKSAIRFDDIEVGGICVPRTGIVAISRDAGPEELADLIAETEFSRIPVYSGTIDDIVGVVSAKRYFSASRKGLPCGIDDLMAPVKYVPETTRASDLLSDFQRTKTHLAVVLDSYGGTVGIITLEDVLESLVGEIWDESDEVSEDISANADGSLSAVGTASVYDLMDALGRDFSVEGYEETTISGYLMYRLGRPPAAGDVVTTDDVRIAVVSVRGHVADRCDVMDLRAPPEE